MPLSIVHLLIFFSLYAEMCTYPSQGKASTTLDSTFLGYLLPLAIPLRYTRWFNKYRCLRPSNRYGQEQPVADIIVHNCASCRQAFVWTVHTDQIGEKRGPTSSCCIQQRPAIATQWLFTKATQTWCFFTDGKENTSARHKKH